MQLLKMGDSINLEQPNSKTRRGRVGHQIAQTLTCSCNQGVVMDMNKSKPKLIGGIGEINFGKQFRQGNRVYDSNEVAMCLMSQPVGNTGGYSYLYTVQDNEKNINLNKGFVEKKYQKFINKNGYMPEMFNPYNCSEIKDNSPTLSTQCGSTTSSATILINNIILEGENKMKIFNNNLQKYNFNMKTIRVFDVFSGIGALHQSLKELGVPIKITNISEIDVDAIISYAGVHIDNFKDLDFDYPSEDKMREWLINRNIGYSFEKQKSSIPRLKKDKLYKVYKASVLLNNLGDISKLNYDDIEDFDLMNFSFSCTDLSTAGKQKGMKNEDGTPTRSGLYVYGINAIKKKKPKYIMIENVKGLIQKKFIDDFYSIIDELNKIGYNCYYPKKENGQPTCLNAKNYGIAQNRERIFVICVRNDVDNSLFEFPKGFDNGLRLKDFLENTVDEKYYLSQEIQDRFKLNGIEDKEHNELNVVGTSAPDFRTIGQRDMTYGTNGIMSTLTTTDYKQPKQIVDKTPFTNNYGKIKEKEDGLYTCLDTRHGNFPDNHNQRTGIIEKEKVEDKYYINKPWHFSTDEDEKHDTNEIAQIEGINYKATRSISDPNLYCRTIDTMSGGQREPKILEDNQFLDKQNRVQTFKETENYIQWDSNGKNYNGQIDRACYEDKNVNTIPATNPQDKCKIIQRDVCDFRIRKLTPKECWRLMGFRDECFDRAKELGVADSSLYKQAGNSIVVNCLYYIFKELFKNYIIEE